MQMRLEYRARMRLEYQAGVVQEAGVLSQGSADEAVEYQP